MRYLFLMFVLFTGCVSVEKAERVMRAHPKELAELCADCFPVKESEVLKGDTIILIDTISEVVSDTIQVQADCPDGSKIVVDCPPSKVITKLVKTHSTDTIKVRDTAYEKILQYKITKLESDNDSLTKSLKGWKKAALWGWGVIGLVGLWIALKSKLKKTLPWL